MGDTATTPDWIVKGAQVVTYTHGRTGTAWRYAQVAVTTIVRVSTKTFTVESGARFDLDTQTARGAGRWDPTSYCVPRESDRARAVLAELRRRNAQTRADRAVDVWRKDRTRESRLAAIAALQAVEDGGTDTTKD